MFRFEVWIHRNASEEQRNSLKEFLKVEMGCPSIEQKDISFKK